MKIKKAIALLLAVAMIATLVVGCGKDSNQPSDINADPSEKVLTLRLSSPMPSTDWEKCQTAIHQSITWVATFEGLYGINEAEGGYYKLLAKDVEISDDQLTYTITLRDAKFQNGDQLKASDVVFSYDRAMQNARFNYVTSMIDDVTAKDDQTVEIKLLYPYSAVVHTFSTIKIVSEREVTEAGDAFGTVINTAGTGPYIMTEFDPAGTVKLKAFKDYWDGEPNIKKVEYILITEDSAAVIAFENGEIGYLHDAPTAEWDALQAAAGENCKMLKGNNIRTFNINWESATNNNILGNEYVRKAIFYAINKDSVNQAAANGYGTPAYEYIPSDYSDTSPKASDGTFELYQFSKEKSHEMLLQAGFTEEEIAAGIPIGTITTYGAQTGEKAKAAQVIQANLKDVGLIAEVEVADVAIISPRLHSYDYDMCVFGDSGNYDYNNIRQQVHSESVGMDVVHYNRENSPFDYKRIEELVDLGVSTSDTAQRYAYYTELWSMICDTATILPILHMPVGICWRDDLDINGSYGPTYYRLVDFSWK